ncbi:MAG TPA: archease [Bacteroidota bacterium]|nr:archease [Bacteroidota bacterium]
MENFKILEHPADVGFEAYGKTLEEAFENAATALVSLITDPKTIREREGRQIELQAGDYEQLLVRWLSEILYLYDGSRFLTGRANVEVLSRTFLKAKVYGEQCDTNRHPLRLDVKAVTYHQLAILRTPASAGRPLQVTVRVFVDI